MMRVSSGVVSVSVRDLIEFVMRSGSIDSHVTSSNRAVLGTLAHKKLQKAQPSNYAAEVALKYAYELGNIVLMIEGRADGIITTLTDVIIDEIKSTTNDLDRIDMDYNPLHWAQAKCYAYIYAAQQNLQTIHVQLTYFQIDTEEIKQLQQTFDFDTLKSFFDGLVTSYEKWIRFYMDWTKLRDSSLKSLDFPFPNYRASQRQLAVGVYKSITKGENLYVNAPTGIGKTVSTLFPALKAMGEGHVAKIFYLTAKAITRTVAENTLGLLYESPISGGLRVKSITLTAKDKICFLEKRDCTPERCPYADGHYDRINAALLDALHHCDCFTREKVEFYAAKHFVCPFEFALDLALWCDVVIGDYNYVFDPTVALKRFADDKEFIYLIDEAHNLVDRARDMYSATLSKKAFWEVKKTIIKTYPTINKSLNKVNNYFVDLRHQLLAEKEPLVSKESPKELYGHVRNFIRACDKLLQNPKIPPFPDILLNLYFEAYQFLKLYDFYDEHYITYAEATAHDITLKIFCIDPSFVVSETLSTCKSAIFFSATLMPMDYYRNMLGGMDSPVIMLPSPFEKEQSLRMIASDVSTKFLDRERSYPQICEYLVNTTSEKIGNYMIFFPSYAYMEKVATSFGDYLDSKNTLPNYNPTVHLQSSSMSEEDREDFLSNFQHEPCETHIGFCVLGGIFSEGIDLTGERLIGVIIVSVGLPQLSLERDLIKHYFDDKNYDGYHYAYTYPGMNKVLQAIGRLIRTMSDKGVVVLLDNRFNNMLYQALFPDEFFPYQRVYRNEIKALIEDFWH